MANHEKWINITVIAMSLALLIAFVAIYAYEITNSGAPIIAVTGQHEDSFILLGSRVHGKTHPETSGLKVNPILGSSGEQ